MAVGVKAGRSEEGRSKADDDATESVREAAYQRYGERTALGPLERMGPRDMDCGLKPGMLER